MPYKETIDWGDGGAPFFYNVNHSVGRACRNAVDDAQLAGGSHGQKGTHALSSQRAILPQLLLHHLRRFTLAS